jgi:hypothetical protein
MKVAPSVVVFFVTALILLLGQGTASAQATRTWVSGVGNDADPCSRTAPCKTFAGAISKTAAAGEINCLDPGGFGAVTITKAITISCQAGTAGVLVSGTNGIAVNVLAGDFVQLRGLDINGLGPLGGSLAGVAMLGGGTLSIEDCIIYGFQGSGSGRGVFVNASNGARVFIENTQIRDNLIGVHVQPQSSSNNTIIIERAVIDSNSTANLNVLNSGGAVVLSKSTLTGSSIAISNSGGSVISYGNNLIRAAGSPNSTVPLQ